MLNSMIYNYIKSLELQGLAVNDGEPAIFEQQAPEDTDSGWEGMQYGRVVYDLRMQDDPARKVSGSLRIMAAYTDAEELKLAEHLLQEAFDQTFFSFDLTIATTWQKTAPSVTSDMDVFGSILYFDVEAFPVKRYVPLDPVRSLAGYIKDIFPDVWMIGQEEQARIWKPGQGIPGTAVYVLMDSCSAGSFPSTYACTWHMAVLRVLVITASYDEANQISGILQARLLEKERFPMEDGSPFFVERVSTAQNNDVLKRGQMQLQGQFGILQETEPTTSIQGIEMTGGWK